MAIPANIVIMWSGTINEIPNGWLLCDGSNGTPNLRNRFVCGTGSKYTLEETGGNKDAVLVSHTHTVTLNSIGNHSHVATSFRGNYGCAFSYGASRFCTDGDGSRNLPLLINASGGHSHSVTLTSSGESATNANLPPYYALAYIMFGGN
jgi:microcystin-dependent protein